MNNGYRVQLDVFSGPLDLLLFLVRRNELDIQDVAIAQITEQYLQYVRLLEQLDPNTASEFLVLAATLVEMKSRVLLPTPPLDEEEEEQDPRATLVRQLLEYKRFRDAADALRDAAEERAKRFVRRPATLPRELQGVELEDAEVWDLLSAFGRVMTAIGKKPGVREIRYDDTPIEWYQDLICDLLARRGPTTFQTLFHEGIERVRLVGLLLALLELIRAKRVRARQEVAFGTIYLFAVSAESADPSADPSESKPADPSASEPPPPLGERP